MDRHASRLLSLALAAACALACAARSGARPLPTSLRAGVDPKTGAPVTRPRPVLPEADWKQAVRGEAAAPILQPDWPDEGTYPERVLDELALHEAQPQAIAVLPTTQSYDRGDIAVIEDDGTILVPSGANVRIDAPALTRKFIAIHNDEYDDICVFAASNLTNLTLGGGFAYELNVKNTITGLGISQFDFSAEYGSPGGVLCSYQNFNKLSNYPADPQQTGVVATNSGIDVITHETGHRFAAYTMFLDADTASTALLGRDDQHWGFFFNSLASEMEGNQWRDNGDGTFTTVDATSRFSFLDEYLFGLRDSSEVDTLWYVANPSNFNPPTAYVRRSPPEIGVTASGTKRFVDISLITAVNGLRTPLPAASPKVRRMAWVLLVRNGEAPTAADLAKIDLYRSQYGPHYAACVHGLASVDTHLNSVAGTVAIAHVPLKDSENTSSPRPVQATMNIAQKSRLIGFDTSSPRLHWRGNNGPWQQVVMTPAGGDDYVGAVPPQAANTIVDYWFSAASDSAGIAGTLPANAPASFFSYRVGVDVTPPVLAHLPPPDPAASQLPLPVRVTVSDNLGVDSVSVTWQKTGGGPVTTSVPATGDGDYVFTIGAGATYGQTISYRFSAVDKATGRNRATIPVTPQPFSLLVGGNYAESFEGGDGGYAHANVGASFFDQWHLESGHQHTPGGARAWKCGATGPGSYRSNLDAGLVSAPIALGPGAHLKFWHDYDAENAESPGGAYDGGLVEVSLDGGGSWNQVTPVGGYPSAIVPDPGHPLGVGTPVYSGSSGGFVQADFDLSAWAGQTARVRWRFVSDGFVEENGWWVDDVTLTSVGGEPVEVPVGNDLAFALGAPRPNPSRAGASIAYALPVGQHVRLALYDVKGRLVKVLWDGERKPGEFTADWNGTFADGHTAPPGLYFYRLVGDVSGTREGRLVRL
jgi:hypothetical protein